MVKEKSSAVSIDFIGGKDVMPITGYFGPHPLFESGKESGFPDLYNEETFQMIAASGIKVIVLFYVDYRENPKAVENCLEMAEKYGIGIFVWDENVVGYAGNEVIDEKEIEQSVKKYSHYPAFCGMFVVDEPQGTLYEPGKGTRAVSKYGKIANILQHKMGLLCYLNMLPIWRLEEGERKANYEQYVAEFCEILQPKVIMWDHYPFPCTEGLYVYFYNMNLMREWAKKQQVPFWAFIQAGAQWNDDKKHFDSVTPYFPNEAQFQWNVNTCLAFGAQGIQYFPIIQPEHFTWAESTKWDFRRNGMIGADGKKNQWFDYAKRINKHIEAIDEVLMNSVHQGIIVIGEKTKEDVRLTTCVIESQKFNELQSVTGNVMIGCFDYNGKTALYVVNYDMESAQSIVVNFDDFYQMTVYQNAQSSDTKTQSLQLDMAAGEGMLIVIES